MNFSFCVGIFYASTRCLRNSVTIYFLKMRDPVFKALLYLIGKAIGLPDEFLAMKEGSKGGGVIQTSASECILVSMLAARAQAIKHLKQQHPFVEETQLLSKLMAYCSKEAHSCVEKAAMISFVKLRILEPDTKSSLRAETVVKVIHFI